jgi:hypothetical protein
MLNYINKACITTDTENKPLESEHIISIVVKRDVYLTAQETNSWYSLSVKVKGLMDHTTRRLVPVETINGVLNQTDFHVENSDKFTMEDHLYRIWLLLEPTINQLRPAELWLDAISLKVASPSESVTYALTAADAATDMVRYTTLKQDSPAVMEISYPLRAYEETDYSRHE